MGGKFFVNLTIHLIVSTNQHSGASQLKSKRFLYIFFNTCKTNNHNKMGNNNYIPRKQNKRAYLVGSYFLLHPPMSNKLKNFAFKMKNEISRITNCGSIDFVQILLVNHSKINKSLTFHSITKTKQTFTK